MQDGALEEAGGSGEVISAEVISGLAADTSGATARNVDASAESEAGSEQEIPVPGQRQRAPQNIRIICAKDPSD